MLGRNHQGLRKLTPDLISKARDDTTAQVTRLLLTFAGTTAFCLLSLLSPDSNLLSGSEKISVPFAGPVSFFGFMLLGPLILIVLRVYLQIYVEHSNRLDRIARRMPVARAPTLVPLKNQLVRVFSGMTFYLLLPLAMLLFAWKAAVFPRWGSALLGVAIGVIASHAMLPLSKVSWRSRALLSVSAAIVAAAVIFGFGPLRRPFYLSSANLSGQFLYGNDLSGANLWAANLSGSRLVLAHLNSADLSAANLSGAKLNSSHLRGASLLGATLTGAKLNEAELDGADLSRADLSRADLSQANLAFARLISANLSGANLSGADLTRASPAGANLTGADLRGANLSYAALEGAELISADLRGAKMDNAGLFDANLSGANLSGANLSGAHLSGANLSGANLIEAKLDGQTQLDDACGADAKLPPGLTLKPCSARIELGWPQS